MIMTLGYIGNRIDFSMGSPIYLLFAGSNCTSFEEARTEIGTDGRQNYFCGRYNTFFYLYGIVLFLATIGSMGIFCCCANGCENPTMEYRHEDYMRRRNRGGCCRVYADACWMCYFTP